MSYFDPNFFANRRTFSFISGSPTVGALSNRSVAKSAGLSGSTIASPTGDVAAIVGFGQYSGPLRGPAPFAATCPSPSPHSSATVHVVATRRLQFNFSDFEARRETKLTLGNV